MAMIASSRPCANPRLKSTGNLFNGPTAHAIKNYRLQQRPEIQLLTSKRKRISFSYRCRASELLQPHRCLPFKCNFPREAKQSGRGIEEPSDRSRRKSPHVLVNQFQRIFGSAAKNRTARPSGRANLRVAQESRPRPEPDIALPHRRQPAPRYASGLLVQSLTLTLPTKISPPQMLPSSP